MEFCRQKDVCMSAVPLRSAVVLKSLTKHSTMLINTFIEGLTFKSLLVLCLVLVIVMLTYCRKAPQEIV